MDNAVVTADDGKLYSVGGSNGNTTFNTGYVYDPAARTWSPIGAMSASRDVPGAAFISGKMYVTGGWLPDGLPDAALEIYNPGSNTWSAGPSVPTAYAASGVAAVAGKMYVVGGCGYSTCGSTDVFAYDPGTNTWSRAASYPQPIAWTSCGGIDGRLYCAGGATDAGTTKNAYVYDPAHDGWTPVASLPVDLWGSGYTAANGQLLVSGGVTAGFSVITNQGFSYDPASNAWSPMANANLAAYRGGSACGFYRIGGTGGSGATAAAELLPGFGACGTSASVPWLSESVLSGSGVSGSGTAFAVAPGKSVRVRFVLDARVAAVNQPGIYTARVDAQNDSPYPVALTVAMTVKPPPAWAKITGRVTGVYCDGSTTALDGATVQINGTSGGFGLHTDSGGNYALWLDAGASPLTVIAASDGWWPQARQVTITPRTTSTANFALKTDAACG
jgi:N-acetylneuraminic acid mutarotase